MELDFPFCPVLPNSLYCPEAHVVTLRHAFLCIRQRHALPVELTNFQANFYAFLGAKLPWTTARRRRQAFRNALQRTTQDVWKNSNESNPCFKFFRIGVLGCEE